MVNGEQFYIAQWLKESSSIEHNIYRKAVPFSTIAKGEQFYREQWLKKNSSIEHSGLRSAFI